MNEDLRKILRLLYLLAIAIAVCYFVFNVVPKLKEAAQLSRTIKTAKMAVKTLSKEEIEKQKGSLQKELAQLQKGVGYLYDSSAVLKNKMAQEKNIALVNLEIEDLAAKSEIDLKSIKPTVSEVKGSYRSQVIEIGFEGTYDQLLSFLGNVEQSPVFMAVETLSVGKKALNLPMLNVRLKLFILFTEKKDEAGLSQGQINE